MFDISPVPEKLLVSSIGSVTRKDPAGAAANIEKAHDDQDLRKACADFESLFLYKLMQTMRKTVPESGLLDEGLPMDIYTDMLDEKISDMAAAAGHGTGLGERLYMELMSMRHKGGEPSCTNNPDVPYDIIEGYAP